jgi:hypothetical protein
VAELIEQNMIVRGALNPAIIQPNWLVKIKVLEKGEEVKAKFPLGTNLAPEFKSKKYRWSVDYSILKVDILPEESPVALKEFVSKVFAELGHTPVTGVGQNFVFQEKAWPKAIKFSSHKDWGVSQETRWGEILNLTHGVKIPIDDKELININLNQESEKTIVRFNFHSDVSNTAEVTKFSKKIEENFKLAQEILEEIKS